MSSEEIQVAIIDFGLGNLYNVRQACQSIGLKAEITSSVDDIRAASALILPGVGAFGRAMEELKRRRLLEPIREAATEEKPILGICLGMQLLMSWSEEFGRHEGLNLIEGGVVKLKGITGDDRRAKVPHVGWNKIFSPDGVSWEETVLSEIPQESFMYFVHSYHVVPVDQTVVRGMSRYCGQDFSSFIKKGNISAVQFHPERSGPLGIRLLMNFKEQVCRSKILK